MAARKKQINLLPQKDWDKKGLIKFFKWVLTIGRYIVVITELIVILSFISRFKLDRDLSDLHEEIEVKCARIRANEKFEEQFREIQNKTRILAQVYQNRENRLTTIEDLKSLLPTEISLESLEVTADKVRFSGYSLTTAGISGLVNSLITSSKFKEASLEEVTQEEKGIHFKVTIEMGSEKKKPVVPKKEETKES